MSAIGIHRFPSYDSLSVLSAVCWDGQQIRLSTSRAQRFAHGHRVALEPQRLLFPERQQITGQANFLFIYLFNACLYLKKIYGFCIKHFLHFLLSNCISHNLICRNILFSHSVCRLRRTRATSRSFQKLSFPSPEAKTFPRSISSGCASTVSSRTFVSTLARLFERVPVRLCSRQSPRTARSWRRRLGRPCFGRSSFPSSTMSSYRATTQAVNESVKAR